MQVIVQILQLIQDSVYAIARVANSAWQWCLTQILAVPWDKLGDMPGSKVIILLGSSAIVFYFISKAARELLAAGEKAFAAIMTLFQVFMRALPPILIAGATAAAGSWVVNNVQF
ncbi:hypothetical protein JDN40_00975 [Rhodomicrobium vannielii ATCC 17100]|uniref:Uncharacterized protein n=1 Tax=Rhodomicrobium udaipurense TaxID=1202716 RepID=A0A8I1KH26_9HYPH|nr:MULTISPECIES: hypothetical protein [Rhodomicrobium]KAI93732.1 hypothetical protein T281_14940 [Rhodomicrobium udaipurense JA643]MBJ7532697.1 hypothetical protein [Rhodomicrobium vannielii ATCC 17100]MBJ7543310.1 hypothetical protein [Rhodomicrobium udaipurense]